MAEKVQSQPFRKGLFCVLTFPVEKVVWDASESTNFKKLLHQPAVNFSPLRQKLLKTLQNRASKPLITVNVSIYASDLFN